ncbi:MAG: signal peptidase II [Gemmatimonadaceae bacterium]
MTSDRASARTFWSLVGVIVLLDVITKALAVRHLAPMHVPREVLGDVFRLTLVYNPGAAFGLDLGPYSRWIFLVLTLVALVVLGRLYRATRASEVMRSVALGLVCGGAVGNLIDRIRSASGVVDFLDVGIGDWRWPTFNIADIAVSVGAFLLAWALWGEEQATAAEAAPAGSPSGTPSSTPPGTPARAPVPSANPGPGR